ncbi:hypothetical protein BZA05DRAFT_26393 [Tricharina praecox]|uniref:uncharacterized protein n=1 Tax=Tricharina praecox TaxID=43433 RepID=UPI00221FF472|nr:uncharacterized protein BZA05DRAFT_26393 [Tricharina praecox]KAI5853355.1 hypothetical protein BZA05DRAFT_26393 [Tricharina praecox]
MVEPFRTRNKAKALLNRCSAPPPLPLTRLLRSRWPSSFPSSSSAVFSAGLTLALSLDRTDRLLVIRPTGWRRFLSSASPRTVRRDVEYRTTSLHHEPVASVDPAGRRFARHGGPMLVIDRRFRAAHPRHLPEKPESPSNHVSDANVLERN